MKEIILSQGKVALVDDDDYAWLNSFNWYAKKSKETWYAVRHEKVNKRSMRGYKGEKKKNKRKMIRMHNFIMKLIRDEMIHHRDSCGLNNQRFNLKRCFSQAENNQYAADKKKENQDDIPF